LAMVRSRHLSVAFRLDYRRRSLDEPWCESKVN
jgi:hypothetical protein